jgi:hypothetical protein
VLAPLKKVPLPFLKEGGHRGMDFYSILIFNNS